MPFRRPRFPVPLSRGHVISKFRRLRKRELSDTVGRVCIGLETAYRSVPWMKLEKLRELARMKNIRSFSQEKAQQLVDDAKEVIEEHCEKLSEHCFEVRDQLLEIEKETGDEDEKVKELFATLSESADSFGNETAKESVMQKLAEYHEDFFAHMGNIADDRFGKLKQGFVKVVEGVKTVIEADFDAGKETPKINEALTYGFKTVQAVIKGYLNFVENGLVEADLEESKEELEPIAKYDKDSSMFIYEVEHDELERKIKTICTEEAKKEDIQKHCITLLEAVKALPTKYKE